MGKSKAVSILGFALDLLQVGFALVIIVLTFWKLFNVDIEGFNVDTNCLLDGSGRSDAISGTKFCVYTVAVAIVSMLVSSIFGCIRACTKCITLNACAASNIVSLVGDVALGVWWTAAFILLLQRGRAANELGWPERPARDGVIAASFGAAFSFFADAILSVGVLAF